jgi:mRNA interferase MazF
MNNSIIQRGDIFRADLTSPVGSEQGGYFRPVLVVQNNRGNQFSPTIVVVPLTSKLRKNSLPTHVRIPRSCGLDRDSILLAEHIRTIDRSRLIEFVGHINGDIWREINKALAVCLELENWQSKIEPLELTLCCQHERDVRNSNFLVVKSGWQSIKETCNFCPRLGWNFSVFNMDGRV